MHRGKSLVSHAHETTWRIVAHGRCVTNAHNTPVVAVGACPRRVLEIDSFEREPVGAVCTEQRFQCWDHHFRGSIIKHLPRARNVVPACGRGSGWSSVEVVGGEWNCQQVAWLWRCVSGYS
jgi:hypothetical protein